MEKEILRQKLKKLQEILIKNHSIFSVERDFEGGFDYESLRAEILAVPELRESIPDYLEDFPELDDYLSFRSRIPNVPQYVENSLKPAFEILSKGTKSNSGSHRRSMQKLQVAVSVAEAKLDEQLSKGCAIRDRSYSSSEAIDAAFDEIERWTRFTHALLVNFFGEDSIADEFSDWMKNGYDSDIPITRLNPSLQEQMAFLRGNIGPKINRLQSIRERLELFEESEKVAALQQRQAASTASGAQAMQRQFSKTVIDTAKEALLEAINSPQKNVVLHGGAMDSDPELDALNLEVSKYCQQMGWARTASNSEYGLILTHSGIEYARTLVRDAHELAVQKASRRILEAAEQNKWEIHWIEDDHGSTVEFDNCELAETDADADLLTEACYRMANETGLIIKTSGMLYRVTEKGRKALYSGSISQSEQTEALSRITGGEKVDIDPKKIFVVHGRDEKVRKDVELFLHRVGLEPIVLFREVSGGKVVIEKFEHHASTAGYAVVILTPEDIGYLKDEYNDGKGKGSDEERARQNVVFEMGYFFARLGRGKVAALQRGRVSKPSDIDGIVYIPMIDGNQDWMITLAKEMQAAGLKVDWSKI